MADEKKRIINETTDTALASSGDYVIVDSQTEGTRKFDLGAALAGKVDTVSGKGLSTNDYTTEEKTKLADIATGATNVTVDNTLSNSGQAADAKATGDEIAQLKEDLEAEENAREAADDAINTALETKANVNGYYQEMTAGDAEQLVSTVFVEDSVPYQFRTSGGSDDIGDREYDEIVGGSVVWNQLLQNGNFASSDGWTTEGTLSVSNNKGTISFTSGQKPKTAHACTTFANHKYLLTAKVKASIGIYCRIGLASTTAGGSLSNGYALSANVETIIHSINTDTANKTYVFVGMPNVYSDTASADGTLEVSNFMVIDLTAMFGSIIADYIYSLEQATAGAGVAWFKKLFTNMDAEYTYLDGETEVTKKLRDYQTGVMLSVGGLSSHDMVGFNALPTTPEYISNAQTLDKSKAVRVVAGQQYQFTFDGIGSATNWRIFAKFWDLSENMQIGGTRPFSVSTGSPVWNANYYGWLDGADSANHDRTYTFNRDGYLTLQFWGGSTTSSMEMKNPCFHLVWDGERDGEYEPYKKHSYPLDDSLTLRGIPKLDANNQLYYDGDIYSADGTVTRKYGVRAYQSGDASDGSTMVTDGTNTVYKLTTPTTETAESFTNPQICDPYGTEEYVTTSLVPVGHYTKYPANLRSAIERVMKQVPEAPSANGTYTLKATRTSSGVTYAWTAE